jgi:hypothetical protein
MLVPSAFTLGAATTETELSIGFALQTDKGRRQRIDLDVEEAIPSRPKQGEIMLKQSLEKEQEAGKPLPPF